jgi:hypothetical protein
MVIDKHMLLFDSDGIQVLWRDEEDLQFWLEGKKIKTLTQPSGLQVIGGDLKMQMVIMQINIVGEE